MNKLTLGKTLCLGMKGMNSVKRKEYATHSKMKDEGNEENRLLSRNPFGYLFHKDPRRSLEVN
jgi:hypothetical protein